MANISAPIYKLRATQVTQKGAPLWQVLALLGKIRLGRKRLPEFNSPAYN